METVSELSIYIQTLVPFTLLDNLCQKTKEGILLMIKMVVQQRLDFIIKDLLVNSNNC